MKLILLFLLFPPVLFAQKSDKNVIRHHRLIDSLVKGKWELAQVDIVDGFDVVSDTNRFKSQIISNKKITITPDSIYSHKDSTLRYYVRNQNYSYQVEYDTLMCSDFIILFSGKGKKMHEVESYEIIKCSSDELVIKSAQFLTNGLNNATISIVYTYRKAGVSDILDKIVGNWFCCSQQSQTFLADGDTSVFEFKRGSIDSLCQDSDNHIEMVFERSGYENRIHFFLSANDEGIMIQSNFSIDPANNCIYIFLKNAKYVYHYELVKSDELIFSLIGK